MRYVGGEVKRVCLTIFCVGRRKWLKIRILDLG